MTHVPHLKIIYRDASIWAIHKPAGIPTYGSTSGAKEILEETHSQRLFPIHRIDSDTEGLVLFALDPKSAAAFIRLFREHKINKTYLAWCVGTVPPEGSYRTPLKKHKEAGTESARTDVVRLKITGDFSHVRVFPKTGRFHQIRRHFDTAGHALVGDERYGNSEKWTAFFKAGQTPTLQLFAESVECVHPMTQRPLKITAQRAGG